MERILIIEDEQLAADKLKMLINKIDPSLEIVGVLGTVVDSIKWLSNHSADLIFLDINLADDISFKIFEQVDLDTPIIFTTAYDQYAIKAFKHNSLDYVLKPVTEEELRGSLAKYEKYKTRNHDYGDKLKSLFDEYLAPQAYKSRVLITYGGKSRSIETEDIAYLYSFEKGTYLTTHEGNTYLTDDTLETLEKALDPKVFQSFKPKVPGTH